jgi:acetolactate synthase-1/2/3 large subunit
VIVAGGGALAASSALQALAEALQAPVVTTINGKGAIPETHALSLGAEIRIPAALDVVNQADVLLMVGTKVGEAELWGGHFNPSGTVIRVDRVESRLGVNWSPDIALLGDTTTVIPDLLEALSDSAPREAIDLSDTKARIREAVREGAPETVALCEAIVSHLPDNAIVAGDSSQVTYFGMASVFLASGPGRFLYTPTFATLGYGLPAAIGAQVAEPGTPVVAVVGDGALMFSVQEFATAMEQGLSLVVICVDNGGYGEIKANEAAVDMFPIGVDLYQPDWPKLADAFGATGHRAESPGELGQAMNKALAGGVHLIHVPLDVFTSNTSSPAEGK